MMNRVVGMKVTIVILVLLKFIWAAVTPFSGDFVSWTLLGRYLQSENIFLGFYTGPSFILAAVYDVWLAVTHNPQVVYQLFQGYFSGPNIVRLPPAIFAFTFVMKIPLLLTDALTLYLIIQVVKRREQSEERALTAGLIWASSPLVFLLEMFNTVEIYPALLIMLGSYAIYLSKIKTGSAFLALGSALRLAPLLISWVYVVALARSRRYRTLVEFLTVQVAVFGFGAAYVALRYGTNPLFQLFQPSMQNPGILFPEGLTFMGPFLSSSIALNPYGLGMGATFAILVAYVMTKPSFWRNRILGAEVIGMFGMYFALVGFYIHFFLWIIPMLVVFAAVTKFGSRRFLVVTGLGLLFALVQFPMYEAAYGKAVLFIPNLNGNMLYVSSILTAITWHPVISALSRSLFGASLVLTVFWVIKDLIRPSLHGCRGDIRKQSPTSPEQSIIQLEK